MCKITECHPPPPNCPHPILFLSWTVSNFNMFSGVRFYPQDDTKTTHSMEMMQDHLPLLDLLSRLSERLSGCKRSMAWMGGAGAPATAGLTESGRPALLAGTASSTCADGVCVSTLRVQLSRVTSGMGARCPSGISCAWQKKKKKRQGLCEPFPPHSQPNLLMDSLSSYHTPNHSRRFLRTVSNLTHSYYFSANVLICKFYE